MSFIPASVKNLSVKNLITKADLRRCSQLAGENHAIGYQLAADSRARAARYAEYAAQLEATEAKNPKSLIPSKGYCELGKDYLFV